MRRPRPSAMNLTLWSECKEARLSRRPISHIISRGLSIYPQLGIRSSCSGAARQAGSTNVQLWTPQIKIRVTAAAVSHQSLEGLDTPPPGTLFSPRPQVAITPRCSMTAGDFAIQSRATRDHEAAKWQRNRVRSHVDLPPTCHLFTLREEKTGAP